MNLGTDEGASAPPADRVLLNGKVYTVDDQQPWAEAVAIRGGIIAYVGSTDGVRSWIGPATRTDDLQQRVVLPGLIDAHIHPGLVGATAEIQTMPFTEVKPLPYSDKAHVLQWLATYAAKHPEEPAIVAAAWRQEDFGPEGPHRTELDRVVSDRPVVLLERWGHSCWMNSKALEMLGVDRDTPDAVPDLTYHQRDASGAPTGWAKEGAGWEALFSQGLVPGKKAEKLFLLLVDFLIAHGVTAVFDAGNMTIADLVFPFISRLDRSGKLKVRYEASHHITLPPQIDDAVAELKRLRVEYGGPRLRFNTIKIHFDGLHTNNTGALLEPYDNNRGTRGATLFSEDRMVDFLLELEQEHINLHVHCWGDQSARTMLNAYERAQRKFGSPLQMMLTLTHLPLLAEADIARFAELGVMANFTPGWNGDVPAEFFEPYFGEHRTHHLFRIKPLLDLGVPVSFCSDMISLGWLDWANPFYAMQVAHTRQAGDAKPDDPVMPPLSERLGLDELVRGYTASGAVQLRLENTIGSIEVGKAADLVVLDDDLFLARPHAIRDVKVRTTIISGETVYQRNTRAVLEEKAFNLARRYIMWSNRAR